MNPVPKKENISPDDMDYNVKDVFRSLREEASLLTNSDLQGRAMVVSQRIIKDLKLLPSVDNELQDILLDYARGEYDINTAKRYILDLPKDTLKIPDELKKAKVIFRYDKNDISTQKILKILGEDMVLQEHRDYDVAFNQNNMKEGIIFLKSDKGIARVLQSYAFSGKPVKRSSYKELVDDEIEIIGV
jgi:hypothetical protein